MSKKILILLGPTATGKTDLALSLAKKFNGELVACDSRQVYKHLDIGTGKMPSQKAKIKKSQGKWEINGIKVWMYDEVEPTAQFNAFEYAQTALKVIKTIGAEGKLAIIVGGTGLYLKTLFEGIDRLPPANLELRDRLNQLSLEELQSRVVTLSPIRWERLNNSDKNNPRRLIRIIEQVSMYGYIDTNLSLATLNHDDILKIGLTAPRPILNERIDLRLNSRLNQGLVKEAKLLLENGVSLDRMRQLGLEYRCLADLLEGKITRALFTKTLKTKIHQYAKRQLTWFKKEQNVR